jgi:hypothetical protein
MYTGSISVSKYRRTPLSCGIAQGPFKFTSTVYEENFLLRVGTIDSPVDTISGYTVYVDEI